MNTRKLFSNFVTSIILVALAFSDLGAAHVNAAPDSIFPPASSVLAQFEFANNTLDSSGNNRNASLIGAVTYTTTTCGTGLQLDALGEGVDWSTYATLLVHPFTIEMILTPTQTASYARLFNFDDTNDNGWYYNAQGIQAYPNPVLGAGTVLPNQRHYIAFVSTSTTNMDVYFQGVLLGNTGFGYTPPGPNAIFFKDNTGGSEQMIGVVDALRISSVSRTSAEIAAVQQRVVNCADNVPPSLTSFTRQNPSASPTSADILIFRATFSEGVINIDSSDFAVNGTTTASITNVATVNSSTYDITVSGGDLAGFNGIVGINLSGTQNITDPAGNALPPSEPATDETYTVDNNLPTVTINQAAGQVDPTGVAPINFEVVFSESVTGFIDSDVTLGGTAGATTAVVTGSGTTYNVAVSGMTTNGTVIASIAAGVVTDASGNGNSASTSTDNIVTYDASGPTVTINQAAGQVDPTGASPINFTVVFSETVTDFTDSDVTLSGAAGATTAVVTGSGTSYNVAVSGMTSNGTVIASIAAGVATDPTGNGNSASTSTDNTVTYNTTSPTVTINQATGQVDPTGVSPINFTVVFSAQMVGFATGDVNLSGTAGATTATVTEIAPNDGTTFNVAVSGMTAGGTITASVPAGVAQDSLGNTNLASSSTDNTVTFDLGYPTVTGSTPANNATVSPGPTQLIVRFNEDVKNDGSAGAANNVANYLLVEDGVDGNFDTLSCLGGLVGDDTRITINSASYTNNGGSGPFVATLGVNSGVALPVGRYRLFVCGTTSIEDLVNNELNNGQSDSTVTFTVVMQVTAGLPKTGFAMNEATLLPAQPVDKAYSSTDLWLEIPKLGVEMDIVGVPFKDGGWDVTWLNKSAGWLNGSAFPTWSGNSVLTGHVWDALNQPGPFAKLKDMKYGDRVKIHAFGQVYIYEIRERSLISPTNSAAMLKHEEKSWLTLITCEDYKALSQTYSSRRMLRAVLVAVIAE